MWLLQMKINWALLL